ncbi:hypothetical protein [Mycobacteroides abscessus]|uniref:hypothetical protein n=1 Tax=Mycobacteroides abscessus TaxID=36809 RepID=UPI0009258708|nr:hypothetical protein [Mycobacteroides abscessus]SII42039.1 Uncharacterised protein [Mycobacteroides abscessus subsp. abscessus]SIK12991.1 Uncharacterised protein [Mycobacteroides abscessus subsp. abscessus]SIN26109.1 Uncharacterised protein [Mycobacteroides abscessus subsp. abscessus]SLI50849.1 Uncharacterised protein [Mycobacteroides abscessus subsp. abscessus]
MIQLPEGMSRDEALATLRQRRRVVTQKIANRKRELRALVAEVQRLETELEQIEQGEDLLTN